MDMPLLTWPSFMLPATTLKPAKSAYDTIPRKNIIAKHQHQKIQSFQNSISNSQLMVYPWPIQF